MADPRPGDGNADGARLKAYWLTGPGAAKWDGFSDLLKHLAKYMPLEKAKRTAATWVHLRYGFWPGDDRNRVRKGKPPRGKRIGPG